MSEELLRGELYESFKNRALIYHLIFDELREELGPDRAEEIISRAIYRRGQQRGRQKFARFAPDNLAGLKTAFLKGVADEGRMFQPEVLRDDAAGLDIQLLRCRCATPGSRPASPRRTSRCSAASPRKSTRGPSRRPAFSSRSTPGAPAARAAAACTSGRGKQCSRHTPCADSRAGKRHRGFFCRHTECADYISGRPWYADEERLGDRLGGACGRGLRRRGARRVPLLAGHRLRQDRAAGSGGRHVGRRRVRGHAGRLSRSGRVRRLGPPRALPGGEGHRGLHPRRAQAVPQRRASAAGAKRAGQIAGGLGRRAPAAKGLTVFTPEKNFECFVRVLGSSDTSHWTALVDDGLVFDYAQYLDLSNRDIRLPRNTSRQFAIDVVPVTEGDDSLFTDLMRRYSGGGKGKKPACARRSLAWTASSSRASGPRSSPVAIFRPATPPPFPREGRPGGRATMVYIRALARAAYGVDAGDPGRQVHPAVRVQKPWPAEGAANGSTLPAAGQRGSVSPATTAIAQASPCRSNASRSIAS